MGTDAQVVVVGGTADDVEPARGRIDDLEGRWSRFRPDSELCRVERRRRRPVRVEHRDPPARRGRDRRAGTTPAGGSTRPCSTRSRRRATTGRSRPVSTAPTGRGPAGPAPGCAGDRRRRPDRARHPSRGRAPRPRRHRQGPRRRISSSASCSRAGVAGALVNLGGDLRVAGDRAERRRLDRRHRARARDRRRRDATAGSRRARPRSGAGRRAGVAQHHVIDPTTGRPAGFAADAVTVFAATAADGRGDRDRGAARRTATRSRSLRAAGASGSSRRPTGGSSTHRRPRAASRRGAAPRSAVAPSARGPSARDARARGRRGHGAWHRIARTRHGVGERELGRVQERSADPGVGPPVHRVAEHRVADGGEVHADLVGAAGLERHREARGVVVARRPPRSACAPRARRCAPPCASGCAPSGRSARRRSRASPRARRARPRRSGARPRGPRARATSAVVRRRRARHHEQPARLAVEAVHDARAGRARPRRRGRTAASRPLTSVPSRWPAPGCTTSPAALSTTTTSSSS